MARDRTEQVAVRSAVKPGRRARVCARRKTGYPEALTALSATVTVRSAKS